MIRKSIFINIESEYAAQVIGLFDEDHRYLFDKYGIEVENAKFQPKVKLKLWDGIIRFFDGRGRTYTKLLPEIIDFINSRGCYDIKIEDHRAPITFYEGEIDEKFLQDTAEIPILLRPYQVDMVNLALAATSGFLESCTGSGKTLTCAALAKALLQINVSTIIIVPSGDLVEQTAETFELCGLDYGMYYGEVKDIDHSIVVATWQALQYNPEILRQFQGFIVDECHTLTGVVLRDLINKHGAHIAYRYGVTGTFPPGKVDKYACYASIGEILYSLPAWKLIELGYLAKIEIQPVEIADKQMLAEISDQFDAFLPEEKTFIDYDTERKFLTLHESRNRLIAEDIMKTRDEYGNTLILVGDVEQGKLLQTMIPDSVFLYGKNKTKERRYVYERFANEDGIIIIATMKIASTGISIDRIFFLGLVDVNKSFTKVIQAIGRGLRVAKDKTSIFCKDYFSNLQWSSKHFTQRKGFYVDAKYPVFKKVKLTHRK